MRRSTRFCVAAVVLLLVPAGAYVVYWQIVAGRIKDGLVDWQQSEKSHNIDASWRGLRVSGFPFAFRVEIENAALRDHAWNPAPDLRLPRLTGTARPWNFDDWRLAAPDGLSAVLASAGGRLSLKLAAKSVEGTVVIGPHGASWLWLNGQDVAAQSAAIVPIKSADAWVILPTKPAAKDSDPSLSVALAMRQVGVPAPPAGFGKTIGALALGITVKGAVPDGPLAKAAAVWRDAGGTIDVDHLELQWGELGIAVNGTLALDQKLQPMAAFAGGIEGFGVVLNALVAADRMTPEQAALVQIALTTLAKPGPDGKPQITVPFTIQNGKMYLGPARLGAAPRIIWK